MRNLVWGIVSLFSFAAAPVQGQVVETKNGLVEGVQQERVTSFLGIPYAAPPTGDNRWKAPQPVQNWSGVRKADTYGPDCFQAVFPPNVLPGIQTQPSEDCLYLNLWKPADASSHAGLPVMVWVHGGGFVNGGSSSPTYAGETFARDGIVFVSINYRLARFGFFAHPALAEDGFGGNFGFLDQIAALQWVQENIEGFGGDPQRVTIFGESAGGGSMHMLLQSPLARGLFSGVIIQSGGGRSGFMPRPDLVQAAASGGRHWPKLSSEQLRELTTEEVGGNISMGNMGGSGYSGPMFDGQTYLGRSDLDAAAADLYASVPILLGANSADGFPRSQDKAQIFATFGDDAAAARRLYDPQGDTSGLEVAVQVSADQMFVEPARAVARTLAAKGQPIWLYRFAHNGTKSGVAMGGAPHASEIPYVFDLPHLRLQKLETGRDQEVATLMHRYWVNFAKYGTPEGEGLPAWPQATGNDTTIQMITTEGAMHQEDPRTEILDLVESRSR